MKFTVKGRISNEPKIVTVVVSAESREEAHDKAILQYKFVTIHSVEEKKLFKARIQVPFDYQVDKIQMDKGNYTSKERRGKGRFNV